MDFESIIYSSNTIISTLKCAKCSKYMIFYTDGKSIHASCKSGNCEEIKMTMDELCAILNHNGINNMIRVTDTITDTPCGFIIEKQNDN